MLAPWKKENQILSRVKASQSMYIQATQGSDKDSVDPNAIEKMVSHEFLDEAEVKYKPKTQHDIIKRKTTLEAHMK